MNWGTLIGLGVGLYLASGTFALQHYVGHGGYGGRHDAIGDTLVFFFSPLYWIGTFFEWFGEWLQE